MFHTLCQAMSRDVQELLRLPGQPAELLKRQNTAEPAYSDIVFWAAAAGAAAGDDDLWLHHIEGFCFVFCGFFFHFQKINAKSQFS